MILPQSLLSTLVACLICASGAIPVAADPASLSFVALGDAPYGAPQEVFPPFRRLIDRINDANPPLVVHVGDLHGHYTCDDALMARLLEMMNSFQAPVLYTPGDNEWADCGDTQEGSFDPLERLDHIRRSFFATPEQTLGATPVARVSQAAVGYPENGRLMLGNVGFIILHVVGSNNNFLPDNPDAVAEFIARNAANVAWLRQSFAAMPGAQAYVVALHADMFVPQSGFDNGWRRWSPFYATGVALGQLSSAAEKPVLLLYGDSHQHKVFQPFPKRRPFLHAIEVYGYPNTAAIEITVSPGAAHPFTVTREFRP